MRVWIGLGVFVGVCLLAGAAGGFATAQAVADWYPTLNKPSWTPPSWLFGPVWTLLYILIGVAGWWVWKLGNARPALMLWAGQLLLNVAWSFLFFGARSIGLGLIDIGLLWIAIAATIFIFAMRSRWAAFLMVPYLCWVSFAMALNAAIYLLN